MIEFGKEHRYDRLMELVAMGYTVTLSNKNGFLHLALEQEPQLEPEAAALYLENGIITQDEYRTLTNGNS